MERVNTDPIASILSKALSAPSKPIALVVDDDPTVRQICRRYLEADAWEVFEAADGALGFESFRQIDPDIVIVDMNMPGINGLEMTKLLRADVRGEDVPVVFLTGDPDPESLLEGLEAGADVHITKPIQKREFTLRVRALSRLRRARRAMEAGRSILGEQTRALSLLLDFSMALSHKEDLEAILRKTVEVTAELTACQRISIMMPDGAGQVLTIAASHGIPESVVRNVRMAVGKSIAGRVFLLGHPVVINTQDEAELILEQRDQRVFEGLPLISVPMCAPERIVGVLNMTSRVAARSFDASELGFLSLLTNYAASAIENFRSRQARDAARDSIVVALAKLAEHRDDDTGTHLDRVTQFCLMLAQEMRNFPVHEQAITNEFVKNLERAAPLHDIGKVAIPDAILLKPGRLSEEEMAVMRTHAAIGADTIRSLQERTPDSTFLKMAVEIAENHHEWFNGNGYPHGKSGTLIPLSARIVALADVYDALTTKRVYKEAMSHRKALEIIVKESGTHFDPDIVKAFLAVETEFERLSRELADIVDSEPMSQEHSGLRGNKAAPSNAFASVSEPANSPLS